MASRSYLLPLILGICGVACASQVEPLEINQADRVVRALGYRTQVKSKVSYRNPGTQPVSTVTWCEPSFRYRLCAAFELGVTATDREVPLKGSPVVVQGAPEDATCLQYSLPAPLPPKSVMDLVVVGVYIGLQEAWPKAAPAGSPLLARYQDSGVLLAPYPVTSQTLTMELGKVQSVDAPGSSTTVQDSRVSVKTGKAVPPFTSRPLTAHFETKGPFLRGGHVARRIDLVSRGSVKFDEEYDLVHRGPKLTGEWSRLDYSVGGKNYAHAAVNALYASHLPRGARDFYFRDGIGNISSSSIKHNAAGTQVLLHPRYPLVGGWSADFKFGWAAEGVVEEGSTPGTRVLVTTFGPSLADVTFDEATVKVLLPAGATLVNVELPMDVERQLETTYDFLSVVGRTVVVLKRPMYVPELNVPLRITFRPGSAVLENAPAVVATGLALLAGLGALGGLAARK